MRCLIGDSLCNLFGTRLAFCSVTRMSNNTDTDALKAKVEASDSFKRWSAEEEAKDYSVEYCKAEVKDKEVVFTYMVRELCGDRVRFTFTIALEGEDEGVVIGPTYLSCS